MLAGVEHQAGISIFNRLSQRQPKHRKTSLSTAIRTIENDLYCICRHSSALDYMPGRTNPVITESQHYPITLSNKRRTSQHKTLPSHPECH